LAVVIQEGDDNPTPDFWIFKYIYIYLFIFMVYDVYIYTLYYLAVIIQEGEEGDDYSYSSSPTLDG
jgi:hypothetical protein